MTAPRPFPSLRITADGLFPEGSFAEAQAAFLRPDPAIVARLDEMLRTKKIGVVAHFYMDPELQGVLAGCTHPHIHVSDSLVMADRAVAMAEAGMQAIVVLGVDFMSENARAMLDAAGYAHVPVYRVSKDPIGCSLASAAETRAYEAYLNEAARADHPLHVVYINTSLETKALAHAIVPTITCTSSNVVKTVLQAAAQVPDVEIFFGPDTYMGRNLEHLLDVLGSMDDARVKKIHPAHDAASVRALRQRFRCFEDGMCIVHHLFGHDVVETVKRDYADAYVTAHLEVPGEMFSIGLAAQEKDRGVVGSTSEILAFMDRTIERAIANHEHRTLTFVLGTEAGMITPIVRHAETRLREAKLEGLAVEIVFPVAQEAIAEVDDALVVVPGVAAGEGCSTAGGCATCPYMKMNSLTALFSLVKHVGVTEPSNLVPFHPKVYAELVRGRKVAELGGEPILHMRAFQKTGRLPEILVDDILGRTARVAANS